MAIVYAAPGSIFGSSSTYAGVDIVCQISVPVMTNDPINGNFVSVTSPVTIGNLQTISVSTHRDKFPVRALGKINPKGHTRGARTVAGSLIFTTFDRESLTEVQTRVRQFYQNANALYGAAVNNFAIANNVPQLHSDELPPFDITITMVNDYGQGSIAVVRGVEIVDNGQVMGIDDLYIEQTMSYTAQEYLPMAPVNPTSITSPATRLS